MKPQLKITEIFYSLQGETKTVGLPTVFVRTTGCPLRCGYCDTAYAFSGGSMMSLDAILDNVAGYSPRYVTLTGGEPLAQPASFDLLTQLCDAGYHVSVETSGAMDIARIDPRVMTVLDMKTPGSGEVDKNLYHNLTHLKPIDQVKFVCCDRQDYEWSKNLMSEQALHDKCEVLFSPSHQQLDNQTLADWILEDNLPVRFQVQLHKVVWGDVAGK